MLIRARYADCSTFFQVHIVKQPFLFNMVWQVFKPFVREKLKNRMYFHGTKMSTLHAHIPTSHLPKNYDGDLPEIDYSSADWYPILIQNEDKIRGEESCVVVGSVEFKELEPLGDLKRYKFSNIY